MQTGKRNVRGYLGNHKNKGHECECSAELELGCRERIESKTGKTD